ncbi:MAG: hypothetical protein QF524_06845, partial [Planctomycetota bacterium]|nr:hypothetical protein [Planctomycetota bacterium]
APRRCGGAAAAGGGAGPPPPRARKCNYLSAKVERVLTATDTDPIRWVIFPLKVLTTRNFEAKWESAFGQKEIQS